MKMYNIREALLNGFMTGLAIPCLLYNTYCIFVSHGYMDCFARVFSSIVLFYFIRQEWISLTASDFEDANASKN